MRNPEIVLNTLCQHSKVSDYKFERLYRILFNKEMFFIAYQRIYAKPGNMTPGTDGQTIDQMSIGRIERLIETLRNESYKPHPAKRVYIPKKKMIYLFKTYFVIQKMRCIEKKVLKVNEIEKI